MANGANLILQGLQPAVQAARPFSNLLQGAQDVNTLARQGLQNQALEQSLLQNQQLAPLQQQLLEGQLSDRDIQTQLHGAQLQQTLDALGAPDVPTAKEIAFNAAKLAALPDDLVIDQAERMRANAELAGRTTDNLDELISAFRRNPEEGRLLLDASIGAFEQTGLITLEDTQKAGLEADKLNLRQQQLALEQQKEKRQSSKLSAASERALIDSQELSTKAGQNASEFKILSDQVAEAGFSGGVVSSFSETMAKLLGTQDDVTELRRKFNKVRLSEGLQNLPPGPATDKDMAEAFKGVPPENAPSSQVVSFLKGAEKMAKFDQAWHEFRSSYISENNNTRGLLPAWKAHAEIIGKNIADNRVDEAPASRDVGRFKIEVLP